MIKWLKPIVVGLMVAIVADAVGLGGASDPNWWKFIVSMNVIGNL